MSMASLRFSLAPAMAVSPRLPSSSAALLSGSRTSFINLKDELEGISTLCPAGVGTEPRRTIGVVCRIIRHNRISGMTSFNDRHSFGTLLGSCSYFHKRQGWNTEMRVAADYPDSKPDASSFLGDLGYHPLEEISSFEKKKNIEHTDRRLTDAELARTLAEVNQNAIIYASIIQDEDHVFGTEVPYLVDEHGDFYFQIDDDSDFLTTLNSAGSYMNVAIGYRSIEDWVDQQQQVDEESTPEDSDDSSSDEDSEEDEEGFASFAVGDVIVLEELEEDSSESVGDWSGLETLQHIHPLDFAENIAGAALADHVEKIEKPSRSLRIVGEVHRVNKDEEDYLQRLWVHRFDGEEEDDEDGEQLPEHLEEQQESLSLSRTSTSRMQNTSIILTEEKSDENDDMACSSSDSSRSGLLRGSEVGVEKAGKKMDEEHPLPREETASLEGKGENEQLVEAADFTDIGTSFYKLGIQSIHIVSRFGAQSTVDNLEFQAAKPDVVAHAASSIIERLNARGKATEDALKALCLQRKGLEAEEVALLELDSLGMDLRVHCGREVQTVRISFSQRATSVDHAEELLNQLLYPRIRHRGRRKRRSRSQGKSL